MNLIATPVFLFMLNSFKDAKLLLSSFEYSLASKFLRCMVNFSGFKIEKSPMPSQIGTIESVSECLEKLGGSGEGDSFDLKSLESEAHH